MVEEIITKDTLLQISQNPKEHQLLKDFDQAYFILCIQHNVQLVSYAFSLNIKEFDYINSRYVIECCVRGHKEMMDWFENLHNTSINLDYPPPSFFREMRPLQYIWSSRTKNKFINFWEQLDMKTRREFYKIKIENYHYHYDNTSKKFNLRISKTPYFFLHSEVVCSSSIIERLKFEWNYMSDTMKETLISHCSQSPYIDNIISFEKISEYLDSNIKSLFFIQQIPNKIIPKQQGYDVHLTIKLIEQVLKTEKLTKEVEDGIRYSKFSMSLIRKK